MLAAQKIKVEEAERERKEEMERMRASRDALRKENQDMREKRSRAIEQANEYLKVAEEKNALKKQISTLIFGTFTDNLIIMNHRL